MFTFCSNAESVVLVNFVISRLIVSEVCDSGIKAVFMNENIRCIIMVAGFSSCRYDRSGSPLV